MTLELAGTFIPTLPFQRCDQFISLCGQKQTLAEIVIRAQSPTVSGVMLAALSGGLNTLQLPDFLDALESAQSKSSQSTGDAPSPKATSSRSSNPSPSPSSLSSSKLRHAAYEPPTPVARLRGPSSSRRSNSRTTSFSDAGHELSRVNSKLSEANEERYPLDELAKTVTAGDLALAVGDIELEGRTKVSDARIGSRTPNSRPQVSSKTGDSSRWLAVNMTMDDSVRLL
jgi:AP-4 complex subunit epsilon-1